MENIIEQWDWILYEWYNDVSSTPFRVGVPNLFLIKDHYYFILLAETTMHVSIIKINCDNQTKTSLHHPQSSNYNRSRTIFRLLRTSGGPRTTGWEPVAKRNIYLSSVVKKCPQIKFWRNH